MAEPSASFPDPNCEEYLLALGDLMILGRVAHVLLPTGQQGGLSRHCGRFDLPDRLAARGLQKALMLVYHTVLTVGYHVYSHPNS